MTVAAHPLRQCEALDVLCLVENLVHDARRGDDVLVAIDLPVLANSSPYLLENSSWSFCLPQQPWGFYFKLMTKITFNVN